VLGDRGGRLRVRVHGRGLAAGGVLVGVFALSLAVFLLDPGVRSERVLFFPLAGSHRITSELRAVPRHRDPERAALELVDAALLGPRRPESERLFPQGTTTRSLLLRRRVLYVDLSEQAAMASPGAPLALADAIGVLKRTIRFNLRGIREIVVYVDGQVPRSLKAGSQGTETPPGAGSQGMGTPPPLS